MIDSHLAINDMNKMQKITKQISIFLIIFCSSIFTYAQTSALFISDNKIIADSWTWIFSHELGLTPNRVNFCYDCKLKTNYGVSDDVARILANKSLQEQTPRVILLQLGCNDSIDANGCMEEYEKSLFDYPFGKVCTKSGTMARTKNIAISKDITRITNNNFAGSFYRVINHFRSEYPDSRIFILATSSYGDKNNVIVNKRNDQIKLVAQLFCIPFVEDANDLLKYNFIWKNTRPNLGTMLLIGDSYCFTRKWTGELEKIAMVNLINLGKTSATLKEKTNGNTNTLGNQLLKVTSQYSPDYILLEGGINDEADIEKVVDNYPEHIQNLKRTNFGGALAYLVKNLRSRFPKAKIYAVTPGGLYYGHTNEPFNYIIKANQIRKAASIIGIPTIDWDREGRLSFVFNNSKGTGNGSSSSPFIYNVPSLETGDLLHPNERGGRYLAENVVAEIIKKK